MRGDPSASPIKRSTELDARDAVLPVDRRDLLAGLLIDDDVETLKHPASRGLGRRRDRHTPALAAAGSPLLKFVAHHLWDLVRRRSGPSHGMPTELAEYLETRGLLRTDSPHAPTTARQRLERPAI